jgi:hypothetical protein
MLFTLVKMLTKILTNSSLKKAFAKKIFCDSPWVSLDFLLQLNAFKRPHYAYCVYHGAVLAKRLGHSAISVAEMGVAGGNGLLYLEEIASRIERALDIRIDVYGFDTGSGLPHLVDLKDLPHWFQAGQYQMQATPLQHKLKKARLILGNVKETLKDFLETNQPAPFAAIMNDLDFYSSTIDSFEIFKAHENYLLPRMFLYFDDIIGGPLEMYGQYTGELCAIEEFNHTNDHLKIEINRNLIARSQETWAHQIYHFHKFDHSQYKQYVGNQEQTDIVKALKLK